MTARRLVARWDGEGNIASAVYRPDLPAAKNWLTVQIAVNTERWCRGAQPWLGSFTAAAAAINEWTDDDLPGVVSAGFGRYRFSIFYEEVHI